MVVNADSVPCTMVRTMYVQYSSSNRERVFSIQSNGILGSIKRRLIELFLSKGLIADTSNYRLPSRLDIVPPRQSKWYGEPIQSHTDTVHPTPGKGKRTAHRGTQETGMGYKGENGRYCNSHHITRCRYYGKNKYKKRVVPTHTSVGPGSMLRQQPTHEVIAASHKKLTRRHQNKKILTTKTRLVWRTA